MNARRRKQLEGIIDRLTDLRADLEQIMDEEIEARDNVPESLQDSERYYAMDEACNNMDSALNSIDEAIDYAESAKGE